MSSFVFGSGEKSLDIKNKKGEIIKSFLINVGEREHTKKWLESVLKVEEVGNKLSANPSAIDELFDMEKDVISSILGAENWDWIIDYCKNNVLVILPFIAHLSGFLKESMESFNKDYV